MLITLYVGYKAPFEKTIAQFKLLMEAVSIITGRYTLIYGQGGYMGQDGYVIDPIRRIEFLVVGQDGLDLQAKLTAIDTLVDSLKMLFEQDSILKTIQYNVSQELV